MIRHGKNTEYLIHLKEVRDSLFLNLSDFASDFVLVPLETKEECLLGRGTYYLTEKYILVQKFRHGILQFDRNGKFIRTLAKQGNGPTEYSRAGWTVDEERQILYMSDQKKKNYFLRYDLQTGAYLGDLKKAIIGGSKEIQYVDDNVLLVIPSGRSVHEEDACYLYYQDTSGQLIRKLDGPPNLYIRGNNQTLCSGHPLFRYQIYDKDTIFTVSENDLIPFMTFDFGGENPPNNSYVGHKSLYLSFEAKDLIFFYNFYITKIEKTGNSSFTSGAMANYILDKEEGKAFGQGPILLNPTHHDLPAYDTHWLRFQPNGIFHYAYQAVDLLEQADKALADPEFKEPYRSKLEAVTSHLSEEDNPVLLLGKFR